MRVLNYIWANKILRGKAVPSSFTTNAVMIAVSGRKYLKYGGDTTCLEMWKMEKYLYF